MKKKVISYSLCNPVKGVCKNPFIALNLPPNIMVPLASIRPFKDGRGKYANELALILESLHRTKGE